jgi:Na+/glutamate symporter
VRSLPTAPVAGGSLIVGYAVAVATGSRALGGVVLVLAGLWCVRAWTRRLGARSAAALVLVVFTAFVLSHVLGLLLGAWPSVLLVSALTGAVVWLRGDAITPDAAVALAIAPPRG